MVLSCCSISKCYSHEFKLSHLYIRVCFYRVRPFFPFYFYIFRSVAIYIAKTTKITVPTASVPKFSFVSQKTFLGNVVILTRCILVDHQTQKSMGLKLITSPKYIDDLILQTLHPLKYEFDIENNLNRIFLGIIVSVQLSTSAQLFLYYANELCPCSVINSERESKKLTLLYQLQIDMQRLYEVFHLQLPR